MSTNFGLDPRQPPHIKFLLPSVGADDAYHMKNCLQTDLANKQPRWAYFTEHAGVKQTAKVSLHNLTQQVSRDPARKDRGCQNRITSICESETLNGLNELSE